MNHLFSRDAACPGCGAGPLDGHAGNCAVAPGAGGGFPPGWYAPRAVWIVLIEDRHADVEALPFSDKDKAIARAYAEVPDFSVTEPLTPVMREDGWVLYLSYGNEGDCVRVLERAMDGRKEEN